MTGFTADLSVNHQNDYSDSRKGPSFQHCETVDSSDDVKPAFKRTPKVLLADVPGKLPQSQMPDDIDAPSIAANWVSKLSCLRPEMLDDNAVWRDLYALTGLPRTFFGRDQIFSAWSDVGACRQPKGFSMMPGTAQIMSPGPGVSWVQANYQFETSGTPATVCSGLVGLVPDGRGDWKIWLLTTILEEFTASHSPDILVGGCSRCHDVYPIENSTPYECVVVGAGFAGLCMSARLKALHVRYITLEKNARVGDNWRARYDSATFHTGRNMSDFPLERVFTDDDPYFLNQKHLARGYESYSRKHNLNIWTNTTLQSASYDERQQMWTLQLMQSDGHQQIKTKHFVLAIGSAGQNPVMPELNNREIFEGTVVHSAEYKSSNSFQGKKGVVIGTANTAHDVAEDMLAAGLSSVTMVQRGKTQLYPVEYNRAWSDLLYHNKALTIESADRAALALPNSIIRQMFLAAYALQSGQEPDRYTALEKTGFQIDRDVDIWSILCGRQGGHYVDVGTSKKIADGLIKIKNDAHLTGFTERGLKFDDGSVLEADLAVFCTGFANDVRERAVEIVGPQVGELLDDYFYVDDEGEIRGAWKPQGHPGIWYTGGAVPFARFFSRFVALQIRADTAGTPLRRYTKKYPTSS